MGAPATSHGNGSSSPQKAGSKPLISTEKSSPFLKNATGITAGIHNLKQRLEFLETEIKNDLKGKLDYEDQISRIRKRRAELEARIKKNQQLMDNFSHDIGPFESSYKALVHEIDSLYGEAKEKHASGLKLLQRDFGYHEAFKRWDDEFSAVPFKPK